MVEFLAFACSSLDNGTRAPTDTHTGPLVWTHLRSSILYDALLDGLDDDPISQAEEPLELVEDPIESLDVEDDLDRAVLEDDEEHDPELDVTAEDLLAGVEDESWSDDPVRMYLTQMGEIPAADPTAGNGPGQADRDHPGAVPPQGAGMRLRDADGREGAAARP